MKRIDLSILIPCFREEKNIPFLVDRIFKVMEKEELSWELVLLDDGSPDGTWEQISSFAAKDSRIQGVRHSSNQGIAPGWETLLKNSCGDWVVTMDADMQYAPEDLPKLIQRMKEGSYDLIQGIRVTRSESHYRNILSMFFSRLLKLVFRIPYEDIKSGFVFYRREVFRKILESRGSLRLFQHWILISAHAQGFKISQVPVAFYPRVEGESFISSPLLFGLKALIDIPKAFRYFKPQRHRRGQDPL